MNDLKEDDMSGRLKGKVAAITGAAGIEWCISFSGFIQRGRTGPAPRGHDGR